jgi:phosphohistidine phosphatase SixA
MKVVLVTHAKTKHKPPRRLSLSGTYEVEQIIDMIKGHMGPGYRITKAVSSSAARCLDTALLCIEDLGSEGISRVETDPRLARLDSPDKLGGVIQDNAQEGLAVFCHADLASALPQRDRIKRVKDGWFEPKPVLAIIDWPPEKRWEEATIDWLLTVPEDESLLKG